MKLIFLSLLVSLLLIGCTQDVESSCSDEQTENNITIFFILGFLDEYLGRPIIEDSDRVEHFYCNEQDKALLFEQYLKNLKIERGIIDDIRKEIVQECLVTYYSSELSKIINSYYIYKFNSGSLAQDKKGKYKRYTNAFISKDIFRRRDRRSKLSYLSGVYCRYGREDTFHFANAKHKVDLIVDLLKELGCKNVTLESSTDTIPNIHKISFHPTEEIKDWFNRNC